MTTVLVCVGSSCHLKGAREVLMRFSELLAEHGVQEKVELRGSFCMDRCGEGVNWQIGDEPVSSQSTEEAVRVFRERVLVPLGAAPAEETGGSMLP